MACIADTIAQRPVYYRPVWLEFRALYNVAIAISNSHRATKRIGMLIFNRDGATLMTMLFD